MKRSIGVAVVVCVSLCAPFVSSTLDARSAKAKASPPAADQQKAQAAPAAPTGFEAESCWQKVDPDLQAAWQDAMKSGDSDRRLDVFVRCQEAIDPGDKDFLESHGFVLRAASGPIASGHLKASDLRDVANLPFVASVKLSTKD